MAKEREMLCSMQAKKGNDKGSNQITAEEREVIGSPEESVGYVQ